ncbi:MAG TPA: peptidylprolyl isomerase [Candidatus Limnocylindria bacterium]|nr:peptidylprolyl isomerase [Candidatus Limnocylindria bacterium]
MITFMRRYRRGLQVGLLVVIVAFIASLFVFGQRGFGDGAGRDVVATVNGESIPLTRYQQRYQAFTEAYARMYRDRFSPELAERLGLPQQVVNELIQEALIVQRARAEGLLVTDEELNAQIQAVPLFQENGRFALTRYTEYLRRRGLTAGAFESEVRRELTRQRVEQAVRGGVKVTPAEVEQAFVMRHEEVRAAWALVELGPLIATATASDEELGKYLGAHSDEFRQPERRRILSVTLMRKDFLKPVADATVEQYYREHPREFEEPKRVHAAHVLARVPETGGSEAEDKARARIADVIRRAKAGEDFAKLAKETSEDPGSAPKGGDLGWVRAGEMVPQFEQALFALKKGGISPEPVRTPFGFHAIRVLDVREGGKKPLKDVAAQIRDRLQAEAAEQAMRARAEAIRPQLLAAPDFTAAAKALGLVAAESTVSRTDRFAGASTPDPLEEAAFTLAQGGVSPPVKTPAGLVLLRAVATIPAGVPALAEIRDRVALAVRREKAEAEALARATRLVAEARAGDFLAAAKKAGAVTGETSRFSRAKPAEKLPGDAMLAALRAPRGAVTEPVKTQQGYYVLRVLERVAPDLGALAGERDKLTKEVLAQKQSQAWESWINAARVNAKIEVHFQPTSRRG